MLASEDHFAGGRKGWAQEHGTHDHEASEWPVVTQQPELAECLEERVAALVGGAGLLDDSRVERRRYERQQRSAGEQCHEGRPTSVVGSEGHKSRPGSEGGETGGTGAPMASIIQFRVVVGLAMASPVLVST